MGGTCGTPVSVQMRFSLHEVSSAGLFGDKKRRGMVEEDRCVLCNEGKQGERC